MSKQTPESGRDDHGAVSPMEFIVREAKKRPWPPAGIEGAEDVLRVLREAGRQVTDEEVARALRISKRTARARLTALVRGHCVRRIDRFAGPKSLPSLWEAI